VIVVFGRFPAVNKVAMHVVSYMVIDL
jgi:hypothetical protein